MAKSKNSSPRRRRCARTRDGSRQFFAEWKNWSEIFPPCPVLKTHVPTVTRNNAFEYLTIHPEPPPILSAYDAFEKKKYANIESTRSFDVAVGWR